MALSDVLFTIFTSVSILELSLILFARVIEVSIGTLRLILMNKGYRLISTILAFFEVLIWVIVVSNVISEISKNPIKVVVYSIGFALGVFLGSIIENKVALGNILIQVVVPHEQGFIIAQELRKDGFGVTTMNAEGKDSSKMLLMIYARRKNKEKVIETINNLDKTALIISNDLTTAQGGFISARRRFLK